MGLRGTLDTVACSAMAEQTLLVGAACGGALGLLPGLAASTQGSTR